MDDGWKDKEPVCSVFETVQTGSAYDILFFCQALFLSFMGRTKKRLINSATMYSTIVT